LSLFTLAYSNKHSHILYNKASFGAQKYQKGAFFLNLPFGVDFKLIPV